VLLNWRIKDIQKRGKININIYISFFCIARPLL